MTASGTSDISWAVVENGLDFLGHAVEEMAKSPADNKYAAIHLFGAIEVLIKARLIREHWTLACKNVDAATLSGFKAGDVPTVDAMQGLKRLESNVGITISKQQAQNVDAVRRLRNRVAHFAVVAIDPVATKTELARGLDFVVWFLEKQILPDAPAGEADLIRDALSEIASVLGEIKAFVAERLATLKSELDASDLLLVCPRCSQACLTVPDGTKCLFCWWSPDDPEAAAAEYVVGVLNLSSYEVIKDGGEWPVTECPECEVQAFVEGAAVVDGEVKRLSAPDSDPDFVCFNCGFHCSHGYIDRCSSCGMWTTSEFGMCPDCIHNLVSRD
ncbi:hypothetical protein Back2_07130 [Nocardioides baekrokdamisoli]|uniref:Uncharacterized protein n=1 Tax=Nocardioides baekrokdamisoli TaxID=1804624 RepID=A0A3G9IDJ0_9ACTN|nr:hypothetical protein [Nocardioides baekrokdamisoli]BBH16426.1 hypothetical protein Back2_07130 [Nocardioides baekrokdamisoli]